MRKEIEELLESELSAYAVSKGSGVSTSIILDLRNKKRKLDNLSLFNAERLYNYYEGVFMMSDKIKELKALAKELNTADRQPVITIHKNKEETINEWKQNGDEDVDWDAHANETLAGFDSNEYVIKVLWTNGIPEYFHESETNEIMDRI